MDTSYLSQQVTTIVERLHGFFDEIGVASHERDSRESELFSALSETLHNQLNLVAKEKHDLTEEAQRLIKIIRQMERSLDDSRPDEDYESEHEGLKVTYPLLDCIQHLKEKHHTIAKLHRERYEQVKKLVEALESYASHLEPSFVTIKLPPTSPNAKVPSNFDLSPTYVGKLDQEFTTVYEEYNKRVSTVTQIADEIINLWSELGTPQAQVDSHIVQFARESPEQLGLHQEDLKRLSAKRDKLLSERSQRERKLKELRADVESLWNRLGVEQPERKQFLSANRGCGLRTINEFEDELSRLNELKRQNLHLFVEDARFKLQEMWDSLYFSEEEMLDFAPAFSDVYSDALLSAHEQEIARLEALREQRAPILAAIDRHRSIIKDRDDLEQSSHDASRLMAKGAKGEKRDPGKLLREEKMRKRITKELPKVEADLRRTLESWEDEYGRPFCVHGERYLDELDAREAKPPPARSKTPNALQPARDAPRSGPKSQPASRNGTVRGPPPPRSKTPTAIICRNPMASSTMSSSIMSSSVSVNSGKASPSKIPGASRLPMSTIRDGNNSPERRLNGAKSQLDLNRTVRGMGPPKAAPPKMKDLFMPPTPTPTNEKENAFDVERSASVVRHVEPEDPYDDRARYQQQQPTHSSKMGPPPQRPNYPRSDASYSTQASRPMSRSEYPVAPPSRQTSNTSSVLSGQVSGSENWETYTDNSENEEADATEAYYAKVKQQQMLRSQGYNKRPAAPGAQLGATKKMREQVIVEERVGVEGSDAGWTDEGDVGDTY
ncbi:Microtubule bundling protein [Vermiconidia calcicola]|uniref:Microtubule bundling protein n=1 Tax=Vermiconidia calcicola TaxID=1690605 RepID=A0ACC3NR81_9PEZI|nr:Microtubule bundling protein [Vermiconidia calcicola]